MLKLTIKIDPLPQPRARVTRHGAYQPTKIIEYKKLIRQTAIKAMKGKPPFEGAITCAVRLYRKYEATSRRFGDLDNLYKAATDAMNGVVYGDDSQIIKCKIEKITNNQPRIELIIKHIKKAVN